MDFVSRERELREAVRAFETSKRRHATFPGVSLRSAGSVSSPRLRGVAAPYDSLTGPMDEAGRLFREEFAPGAFDHACGDTDLCVMHDADRILARQANGSLRLTPGSSRGLLFEADIADTSLGRDAVEMVRTGLITSMSVGFVPARGGTDYSKTCPETGLVIARVLRVQRLHEVSLVPRAAYGQTSVASGPANDQLEELREKVAASRIHTATPQGGTPPKREQITVTARAKPKNDLATLKAKARVAASQVIAESDAYETGQSYMRDLMHASIDRAYSERLRDNVEARGGSAYANSDSSAAAARLARYHGSPGFQRNLDSTNAAPFIPVGYTQTIQSAWQQGLRSRPFLAATFHQEPLQPTGETVIAPGFQVGTSVSVTTDGSTVVHADPSTRLMTGVVAEAACYLDLDKQLLDRGIPAFDRVLSADMGSAYATALDSQLINGSGSAGEITGLRNISGIQNVTFTSASPSAESFLSSLTQGQSAIATATGAYPDVQVMHARRHAWLMGVTAATYPLVDTDAPASDAAYRAGYVGTVNGCSTYVSTVIPTTVASSQDVVVQFQSQQAWLFTSPPSFQLMSDILSGTLQVRALIRGYFALLVRVPESIAVIGGTGLAQATGW